MYCFSSIHRAHLATHLILLISTLTYAACKHETNKTLVDDSHHGWHRQHCPQAWHNHSLALSRHTATQLITRRIQPSTAFLHPIYVNYEITIKPLARYFVAWYADMNNDDMYEKYKKGTMGLLCHVEQHSSIVCWDYYIEDDHIECQSINFKNTTQLHPLSLWRASNIKESLEFAFNPFYRPWHDLSTVATQYDPFYWNYTSWQLNDRWSDHENFISMLQMIHAIVCRWLHLFSTIFNQHCYAVF